ncbi:MAG: hypothetical protein K2G26_04090 [Clostridia bacterium]|nr:hypothetical protein [Clostridia bacterium]
MDAEELLKTAEAIYKEAYKLAAPCEWCDVDGDCEIRYLTGNTKYYWTLLCCGLKERLFMKSRSISEKEKIRSNTKNYYKLFYKDGRLVKVEDYIENKLSRYFLCFYTRNARVLQSFDNQTKKPVWHYCIVTWFSDFGVEKEVWINEEGSQIIFSEYIPQGNVIEFRQANCLPHTTYKEDRINFYYRGEFRDGGTTYECLESHFAY